MTTFVLNHGLGIKNRIKYKYSRPHGRPCGRGKKVLKIWRNTYQEETP